MNRLAYMIIPLLIVSVTRPAGTSTATAYRDLFVIRVTNSVGGAVEVGRAGNYRKVGTVRVPATETVQGFAASTYVPNSSVAATAVHGIRIKTGSVGGKPRMISLVPLQFAEVPKGYGGHIPYRSGIYTDIPAGVSLFRSLSPFVGNRVYLKGSDGKLRPLPASYRPAVGDVIVIHVRVPTKMPVELEFENRRGGDVLAKYSDGSISKLASVVRPVEGVGRFDGTSYTGVGAVNTNHAGVLTISTAPVQKGLGVMDGEGEEKRGGFMIQPSRHAKTQPVMGQVMIVERLPGASPLEGAPPMFSECINLAWNPDDPHNSYRAEVRINSGEWQPAHEIVGKDDHAFSDQVRGRVTHIRLLFPQFSGKFVEAEIAGAAEAYSGAHTSKTRHQKPLHSSSD